jgi:hypothetical protein
MVMSEATRDMRQLVFEGLNPLRQGATRDFRQLVFEGLNPLRQASIRIRALLRVAPRQRPARQSQYNYSTGDATPPAQPIQQNSPPKLKAFNALFEELDTVKEIHDLSSFVSRSVQRVPNPSHPAETGTSPTREARSLARCIIL